jgi:hypothetical protein
MEVTRLIQLIADVAVGATAIASLLITLSALRASGKLVAIYEIGSIYDGQSWLPVGVKVTLTNVGAKPLLVASIGRASGDGTSNMVDPILYAKLQVSVQELPSSMFVIEPHDLVTFVFPVLHGEGPGRELATPLRVILLEPKRKWNRWTYAFVEKVVPVGRRRDASKSTD